MPQFARTRTFYEPMTALQCCAECGAPLPAYWPKALCAPCAIDGALSMDHAASQVFPQEPGTAPVAAEDISPLASFGEYDLLEEIARGGMGVVYKARQRKLGRIVAVKMILAGPLAGKEFVRRFRTEASAAAILQHPNIVAIHDVGVYEGRHYFSMDYVEGQNLAQMVGIKPLPPDKAARYVEVIAGAIHYAHERGILHRDLKPSNVLIDLETGQPRVTDFGLAKRLVVPGSEVPEPAEVCMPSWDLTISGQVIGSPNFMPPEQAGGKRGTVGRPSDVYALGGILYYLLTARAPFQADSLEHTIEQVLNAQPVSPRLLNRSIPRDLETITLKCLEKEPTRRYQTAQELADELGRVLRREPIQAHPVNASEKLWRWCRRKPVLASALGFAIAAPLVGLATTSWQWQRAERHAGLERQERIAGQRQLYVANMNLAQAAWEQNNITRVRELLDETAMAPERGFEWYYWQRQIHHPEEKILREHDGLVLAVAYSPVRDWIVTGSADHTAKVWNAATGKVLRTLGGPNSHNGHKSPILSVVFSSDGQQILTGSWDGTAKVWDAVTGGEVRTLPGNAGRIFSMAFSPDGKRIVTGGPDQTAKVWDIATGGFLPLTGHTGAVWSVAFSPDGGRIVTGSWDKTAKVWDAATGGELATFSEHGDPVLAVAFSPDGKRIVSGSFDQTARVWEAANGHELFTLAGHGAPVVSVTFSADDQRIATAGDDQTARVWDANGRHDLLTLKRHGSRVSSVAFSPDGRQLVTGGGSVSYQPDGKIIALGEGDRTARIWDLAGDTEPLTLKGHTKAIMSAAFSSDGRRIVTGSMDQTAKIWDAASGTELHTLTGHRDTIRFAAISPDGLRVVTGSWDKTAIVWDAVTGSYLRTLEEHSIFYMSVAFSRDGGRIVTSGQNSSAKVWDTFSGNLITTLHEQSPGMWSVAFSPDGRRIVSSNQMGNFDAMVWDANSGNILLSLQGHNSWIFSAAYSLDGQRIVTGSKDGTAKIWDATSGENLLPLKGHKSWVMSVGFSPDGKRIVTGSQDGTAKLWDAASGKELLTFKGRGWVFSAAFSPDGQRIVTGDWSGMAKVWEVASKEQVAKWQEEERTAAAAKQAPVNPH